MLYKYAVIITTSESILALTSVAIMSVHTEATILARTRLALILFLVTVLPYPASLTLAMVPGQTNGNIKISK